MSAVVWLMRLSLLGGWLPSVVAVVAWGALVSGVAWRRRAAWHWALGAVGVFVSVLIVTWIVDIPARVGGTYPTSFVLWAALPLFALVATVWQLGRVPWWRTLVALAAVPALVVFGALQINSHYAYLPTLGDALGAPLPGQVAPQHLDGLQRSVKLVARRSSTGIVTQLDIPAPNSRFSHRPGWVWLPPIYFSRPRPHLPVLMLIAGSPGGPADWLRAGNALDIANSWANTHHGNAPIIVVPDANGSFTGDTECVDGPRGRAETYLTIDVPTFMHNRFGTATDPHHWAIVGLSEGGTCALDLVTRHPDRFATFGDFSGDPAPTIGTPAATLTGLYGGSRRDERAHQAPIWFAADTAAGVQGYFAVGALDHTHVTSARNVVRQARLHHMHVRFTIIQGHGHDFRTWARALHDAYPWIVHRLDNTTHHPTTTTPTSHRPTATRNMRPTRAIGRPARTRR